ncbi:PAS/PAC sensor hybrid histidine kinase [Thermodesulfovibrio sp. N1]|uniref:response regulator n=1 Tax=Thermodesulfovibrio sp. N1 TaxID=1871110 RepID=UPI00083A2E76|nr:response regulator [Thermodesulfovibrio sp. N1]ODA44042.1 PAS/PAC sensor hybrid histidine kinase [Thermodesulfovibrio sp. N1]
MSKKALVIEDNGLVGETLKAMLEFLGFDVVVAEDGYKAKEQFKSAIELNNPFDVVFVDLVLPEIPGSKVFEKLKEIDPNIKAIISSGYSDDTTIKEYEKLGFKGILNKPYTIEELREIRKKLSLL